MDEVIPNTRNSNLVYLVVSTKAPKIKWPVDVDFPPRFGLANKFFEALTAGRPILSSIKTYNGILVEKLGCGVLTECDEKEIRNKILYLKEKKDICEKMGKAAFNAGKNRFNWEYQEEKLLETYKNILNR
jgi:glycosyltransferase involved in cell wall biosynthesis